MKDIKAYAYPISSAQHRLWLLSKFDRISTAYNITGILKISRDVNIEILKESILLIIDRHETLRTTFREVKGEVKQVIHERISFNFEEVSVGPSEASSEILADKVHHRFDLENGPLLRIVIIDDEKDDNYQIIISMHHIISDGWSIGIFTKECSSIYNSLLQGEAPNLEELEIQYADFTLWEKEEEETQEFQNKVDFWEKILAGSPALLELPYKGERPALQTFDGDIYKEQISLELTQKIKAFCLEHHVSPFMFLLAVYKITLSKYANQKDLLIGVPVANRNAPEVEQLIGFFVNTVVIRTQIDANHSFKDYLNEVKKTALKVFENKDISFETVLERVKPPRSTAYNPLFQVMFSLEDLPKQELIFNGVPATINPIDHISAKFDLTLAVKDLTSGYAFEYEYNTRLFDEQRIANFSKHYLNVLSSVLEDASTKLTSISLLDTKEEARILNDWNQTSLPYEKESSFIDQFVEKSKKYANSIAYVYKDIQYTYEELDNVSNQFAHALKKCGVGANQKVVLFLKRDEKLLPVLLAVMKLGATYIPLDITYPEERIQYIINDCSADYVLCNEAFASNISKSEDLEILSVESIVLNEQPNEAYKIPDLSDIPVYTIYTSGSTGNPKGVRIGHTSLLNFLTSMQTNLHLKQEDVLLAVTSLAFDISGLELYLPLLSGACVVLANEREVKSSSLLMNALEEHSITVMQGTPTLWKMLREMDWAPQNTFKILCGGEALPHSLAEWFRSISTNAWNLYGPTETTIWSSISKVGDSDTVTIGKPIHNTTMYILNSDLIPVPIGSKGELYIGGDGLAIDYYNRPELNAEKFIWWEYKNIKTRLFKTGDVVKYNVDGTIAFHGRNDSQVKVNGYRIELQEIEIKLAKLEEVDTAIVLVNKSNDLSELIAYLKVNTQIELNSLREQLKQLLPVYMIPGKFIMLDEIPLTPNGKIDRKALKGFIDHKKVLRSNYTAPETEKETILVKIWQEVLDEEKIGVKDDFFELGGASLQSVRISNQAQNSGLSVSPEMIFEFSTIRELAQKAEYIIGVNTGGSVLHANEIKIPEKSEVISSLESNPQDETKIVIESMGEYLPKKEVLANELVNNCKNEIRFPLSRLTGIESVFVVEDEFSLGLAEQAIENCLAISKFRPENINLVITCNVFRMENARTIAIEPSMSITLSEKFGFDNAIHLDITNACTGIFTAIYIAEAYLKSHQVDNCLVVSGEYISHMTRAAQLEVESYMDSRISGLTLGDAGLAMILERSTANKDVGFHKLDLFTMGAYCDLCIVKPTEQEHGGFVVKTDAIKMGQAGHAAAANHALKTLYSNNWGFEQVQKIIMHQASSITTQNAMREINRVLGMKVTNSSNIIDNIKNRGNTATTSYWIATIDNILNGEIEDENAIIYCISGSGLTLGTALYKFDDLPSRIRDYKLHNKTAEKIDSLQNNTEAIKTHKKRLKISSIGVNLKSNNSGDGLDLMYAATDTCLTQVDMKGKSDFDAIIYFGVHREQYMYEPAIATFLASQYSLNSTSDALDAGKNTLAFDIINGSLGFLNTCHAVLQLTQIDKNTKTLISTSEINNNERYLTENVELPIIEGAASLLLEVDEEGDSGFGQFVFKNSTGLIEDKKSWAVWENKSMRTTIKENLTFVEEYAKLTVETMKELLEQENLAMNDIKVVFVPEVSDQYIGFLKTDTVFKNWTGTFSMSKQPMQNSTLTTPLQLHNALYNGLVSKNDVGIIINLAAGVQVCCASYYF